MAASISPIKRAPEKQIFLSHSGLDRHLALDVAARLQQRLADCGFQVRVFNTSAESKYIEFEMDTAEALALEGKRRKAEFFFPLLAEGADYEQLSGTKAMTFQAVKLDDQGLDELLDALRAILDSRR